MGRNTNIDNRFPSVQAVDTESIFQITDFENFSLPTISLEEKLYILHDAISTGGPAYQFSFIQNATTSITAINRLKALLVSITAIDAFFETAASSGNLSLNFDNLAVIYLGTPTGSVLFDLSFLAPIPARALGGFASLESQNGVFRGFGSLGTITNTEILAFINCLFGEYDTGIVFEDVLDIGIGNTEFISNGTGSTASLELKGDISAFTLRDTGFSLGNTESVIRIDPAIPDDARISVSSVFVRGPGTPELFDTSGSMGPFTAVTDDSELSIAIASVTSGTVVNGTANARFNYTGKDVSVNQILELSGFTGDAAVYNGTHRTSFVSNSPDLFELKNVVFVEDATGSFDINAVIITSTAHGLVNGDTINIDTANSTDYDGGAYVFGASTNFFTISRTFTSTATGSWSTRGLDQKDPRVLAFNNADFLSSKYIGCAFVNGEGTVTTISNQNEFTDIVFTGLAETSVTERFKVINLTNGIFEYFGNEPFEGSLSFVLSGVSGGSGSTFGFKFFISTDGGSSFGQFPDEVEGVVEMKTDLTGTSLILPVVLDSGDQFKLRVENKDGTENVTIKNISIYCE